MKVSEAIQSRRAVKSFDPVQKMTEAEFQELMGLVALSPTSFNIQNWRFVRVTDAAKREAIKAAAWNQSQITDASELLILCADLKAWEKEPARYSAGAPDDVKTMLAGMTVDFYKGREWIQCDEAMCSVGIAAQTLMLAAQGMGYDSCPMIGFDQDAVAKIINLPADHVIGMIVTVGKKAEDARPRAGKLSLGNVVITNGF